MMAEQKKSLKVNNNRRLNNMFNFINSWKSRKSEKWNIEVRLGRLTLLQLNYNKTKFRFMVLNIGFEYGV